MTLVQLLRLRRFCDNLPEPEVNRLLPTRGLARALLHIDARPMMSMPDEGLAAFPVSATGAREAPVRPRI